MSRVRITPSWALSIGDSARLTMPYGVTNIEKTVKIKIGFTTESDKDIALIYG